MNRRIITAVFFVLFLTGAALAQPSTWIIDTNHAQADFSIEHMSVSTVRGSIGGVNGTIVWDANDLAKSSVNATMDAATVSTNNGMRDKDLKSATFFNVEKFPTITFKSTAVNRVGGKLQVTGDLTMAGVTKSVTLNVDGPTAPQKGMGDKTVIGLSATGTVRRSDFHLGAKYPAAVIGEAVQITIDVEADQ